MISTMCPHVKMHVSSCFQTCVPDTQTRYTTLLYGGLKVIQTLGNVMICADESHTLRAKVCDFGLSRILGYRREKKKEENNNKKEEEKKEEEMSRWQRLVVRVKGSATSSTEEDNRSEISSSTSTEDAIVTSVAGTPSHMAPELLPDLMSAMKAYVVFEREAREF